jgi:hypothetical protein
VLQHGDLVKVGEYYGIVENPEERTVMLGNGLTEVVDEKDWLSVVPLGIRPGSQATANFREFRSIQVLSAALVGNLVVSPEEAIDFVRKLFTRAAKRAEEESRGEEVVQRLVEMVDRLTDLEVTGD